MLTMNTMTSVSRPRNTRKANNRHEVHKHAEEYLEKISKMKADMPTKKIKQSINIGITFAEHFVKGLETMFSALKIRL